MDSNEQTRKWKISIWLQKYVSRSIPGNGIASCIERPYLEYIYLQDVVRTDRDIDFYAGDDNLNVDKLATVLGVFCTLHRPDLPYVQGMVCELYDRVKAFSFLVGKRISVAKNKKIILWHVSAMDGYELFGNDWISIVLLIFRMSLCPCSYMYKTVESPTHSGVWTVWCDSKVYATDGNCIFLVMYWCVVPMLPPANNHWEMLIYAVMLSDLMSYRRILSTGRENGHESPV